MSKLLLAGIGGFVGAALRHALVVLTQRTAFAPGFLTPTLLVNVLGCAVIGVLSGVIEVRGPFSPELRALVLAGLLGGFTTYSTFASESVSLFRDGERGLALLGVGLHLVLGLGAVWVGLVTARWAIR